MRHLQAGGEIGFLRESQSDAVKASAVVLEQMISTVGNLGELLNKKKIAELVLLNPAYKDFVSSHFEFADKDIQKSLVSAFVEYFHGKKAGEKRAFFNKIWRLVEEYVKGRMMDEGQEKYLNAIPEELRKFLPKTLAVDVDSTGEIQHITDLFVNEVEDVNHKIKKMTTLLKRYNHIVDVVKTDMMSKDVFLRVKALIVAIIMETGIRPAMDEGISKMKGMDGKYLKDEEGEYIEMETFGARTLKLSFIKDLIGEDGDQIEVRFRGKAYSENVAYLSDPKVLAELRSLATEAEIKRDQLGIDPFLFTRPDGDVITGDQLSRYFKKIVKGTNLTLTDFRKLKATQEVFDHLKNKKIDLLYKIREFANEQAESLKERATQEIADTVNQAIRNAQEAISHGEFDTTVSYYINPTVVLKFLSEGKVGEKLEDAVMTNPKHLTFNLDAFLDEAVMIGPIQKRGTNLQNLVDDLEMKLGENLLSLVEHIQETT